MAIKHGTTAFFIKSSETGAQLISSRELEDDQRSLDLTSNWQPVLKDYGWNLIRPPRICVFYDNDVLYVNAETPANMMRIRARRDYQNAVIEYNRAIASLIFPHTNISQLPVNPQLRSSIQSEHSEIDQVFSHANDKNINIQAIAALEHHFDEILTSYNHHQSTYFTTTDFAGLDKRIAVMEMLRVDNLGFLREILPRLLNKDFSKVVDDELLHTRDLYLHDYEENLPNIKNSSQIEVECNVLLKKESVIQSLKDISKDQFSLLLAAFNQANNCFLSIDQFAPENRYIVVMEMLNRSGQNITFLRQGLRWFLDIDLSTQTDHAIFALRDRVVQDYMDFIDKRYLGKKAKELVRNVDRFLGEELKPDASIAEKFLKLAIRVANSGIQAIAYELGLPLILKENDRLALSRQLLASLAARMNEDEIGPLESEDLLPQTQQLLDSDPDELSKIIDKITDEFTNNKALQHQPSLLFFLGKHRDTISKFVQKLHELNDEELSTEQLKFGFIGLLQQFHDDLVKGKETKPLVALTKILNELPAANSWEVPTSHFRGGIVAF